jgi:MFS transporter, FSR family, fosmidomycin resistance protein
MTDPNGFIATAEEMRTPAVCMTAGATVLSVYAAAHLVVDACCAAVVFGVLAAQAVQPDVFTALLLLYHVIAFGLQPVFGLLVDALGMPRLAAVVGCLVSAVALLIPSPIAAVVVTSLGNALFHVGGGVISLQVTPHRATAPGLFVAPGSLGLLLGMILGKSGSAASAPLLAVALVLCVLMAYAPAPQAKSVVKPRKLASRAELVLALVMLPIAVRSLLGTLVSFPWETQPRALLGLIAAIFLGKAVGGILADRWGWARVAIGSLVAALPLLACSRMAPLAAIPGLFLLNITMPVTLLAVAESLPGRPGFSFGLTTLALLFGVIPHFFGDIVSSPALVCLVGLLALAGLDRGLRLLSNSPSFRRTVGAQS